LLPLIMDLLVKALLDGDAKEAASRAGALTSSGVSVERIVTDGVEAAMGTLDAKCTLEQFNLLEIMLVGRAVTEVMKHLFPAGAGPSGTKGTVVIATLEGDVHDLGKNILKMVLTGNGYRVIDCGKDCPVDSLVDAAERERPVAVGISGLIATILPEVRQVKPRLADRGLSHVLVIAGGAVLKQSSPDRLNVDYVAESAFDGARYINSALKDALV
jgi:methylmalonyl-CoA mutase cobalamin-binding domain/chain